MHTAIRKICDDFAHGIQVVIGHGDIRGTVVIPTELCRTGRPGALARWTLSRLRESGRETGDLVIDDIRTHRTETQLSFLRGKHDA